MWRIGLPGQPAVTCRYARRRISQSGSSSNPAFLPGSSNPPVPSGGLETDALLELAQIHGADMRGPGFALGEPDLALQDPCGLIGGGVEKRNEQRPSLAGSGRSAVSHLSSVTPAPMSRGHLEKCDVASSAADNNH